MKHTTPSSTVTKHLLLWYCIRLVANSVWKWLCCSAGGSQPLNGHGWVRLYEQRHEMSVQIWRPQSLHVWMSRRWGHKASLSSSSLPWRLSLIVMLFLFSYRWCIQCRDRRPVWAPEANYQQFCVAHPQGLVQRPSSGAQRLLRASWGQRPSALGTSTPNNNREHTNWCLFIPWADVDKIFISAS